MAFICLSTRCVARRPNLKIKPENPHLTHEKRSETRKRALSVPAQPILNFDTSVKELNDAIVRAEFRNMATGTFKKTGDAAAESTIKDEETCEGYVRHDQEICMKLWTTC